MIRYSFYNSNLAMIFCRLSWTRSPLRLLHKRRLCGEGRLFQTAKGYNRELRLWRHRRNSSEFYMGNRWHGGYLWECELLWWKLCQVSVDKDTMRFTIILQSLMQIYRSKTVQSKSIRRSIQFYCTAKKPLGSIC